VTLIWQTQTNQIWPLFIEHLVDIRVTADSIFVGTALCSFRITAGNRAKLNFRVRAKNPRVLPTPTARTN
jgi:hypothetical protein